MFSWGYGKEILTFNGLIKKQIQRFANLLRKLFAYTQTYFPNLFPEKITHAQSEINFNYNVTTLTFN